LTATAISTRSTPRPDRRWRRPLSVDAGAAVTNITSAGVSIAEHEVFAAAGGLSYEHAPGYVIAYRAG